HISSQADKLGCDCCSPSVELAQTGGHEAVVCHSSRLPCGIESFNTVLSTAGKFYVQPVATGQTCKESKLFRLAILSFLDLGFFQLIIPIDRGAGKDMMRPDSCINTMMHHFSTGERCMQVIKEMAHILRVGGQIMIYVWAMEQKWGRFEKQDNFVP
ncbi:LOW QUALITY PROTEIN: probable tRNA methyltransferase 9B, partial [Parus major]|uniref:LOW QUALITY PROTEIN: probable tRNA methyltransferase 9B n=1 Tax=Parus major TaxID=9157 RepID=UPI001444601D